MVESPEDARLSGNGPEEGRKASCIPCFRPRRPAADAALSSRGSSNPKLLDRLRDALRAPHYSRRTAQTYAMWVKRFCVYHRVRHPAEMGAPEINAFLTHLAVKQKVSPSTQTQALSAQLFLFMSEGFGRAPMPYALDRTYPGASSEWRWQFVFPQAHRWIIGRATPGIMKKQHITLWERMCRGQTPWHFDSCVWGGGSVSAV